MQELFELRDFEPDADTSYVYDSWLRHYLANSYFAKRIKSKIYFEGHSAIIAHILSKPDVKIEIACPDDGSDTILGYIVCEPSKNVCHYIYIREGFRNNGIATALFKSQKLKLDGLRFTHWTFALNNFYDKHENEIQYDPYSL